MKYYCQYNKETGRVVSYSEGINDFDNDVFSSLVLDVSQKELDMINRGYIPYVKNDILILEETSDLKRYNKKENILKKLENKDLKTTDLIDIIKELV